MSLCPHRPRLLACSNSTLAGQVMLQRSCTTTDVSFAWRPLMTKCTCSNALGPPAVHWSGVWQVLYLLSHSNCHCRQRLCKSRAWQLPGHAAADEWASPGRLWGWLLRWRAGRGRLCRQSCGVNLALPLGGSVLGLHALLTTRTHVLLEQTIHAASDCYCCRTTRSSKQHFGSCPSNGTDRLRAQCMDVFVASQQGLLSSQHFTRTQDYLTSTWCLLVSGLGSTQVARCQWKRTWEFAPISRAGMTVVIRRAKGTQCFANAIQWVKGNLQVQILF